MFGAANRRFPPCELLNDASSDELLTVRSGAVQAIFPVDGRRGSPQGKVHHVQYVVTRLIGAQIDDRPDLAKIQLILRKVRRIQDIVARLISTLMDNRPNLAKIQLILAKILPRIPMLLRLLKQK